MLCGFRCNSKAVLCAACDRFAPTRAQSPPPRAATVMPTAPYPSAYDTMRILATAPYCRSRRSSASAIAPTPWIGSIQASARRTETSPGARSASATTGAITQRAAKKATPPKSEMAKPVWMCSARSFGCCTSAGPTSPCEIMETKLTTNMPADTDPKSAGESRRARTASDPTVTKPWTTAPEESQSQPPNACSVRLGRGPVGGGASMLNGSSRCRSR